MTDDRSFERFQGLMLRLRGRTGLTQRQLADRIGVHIRSIQAWESGLSYPNAGRLQLLIAAFVDAHGFAARQELIEAEALWVAAVQQAPRLRPPFDRDWFNTLLERRPADADHGGASEMRQVPTSAVIRSHDWSDAPESAGFVGRIQELDTLTGWLLDTNCRVAAVFGAGGVGKTRLAARLVRDLEGTFERGFWRSVRNAPSATEWLGAAIGVLSGQQQIPPDGEAARLAVLLELLRAHRCIVVLDNLESLLEPGRRDGTYRDDVGGYGDILRVIGQSAHQSCVIVTSRELPAELAELRDPRGGVRALELRGLGAIETPVLLGDKLLYGNDAAWAALNALYAGNCLALRVVGQTIQQVFGSDIRSFLSEAGSGAGLVYGGIRRLLDAQISRLSSLEQELLRWLAIERDPVTFGELAADLSTVGRAVLIEVIDALRRRSLVERLEPGTGFTLQSVVLEHVTDALVESVTYEIEHSAPRLLVSHSLVKAQSKDYLRRTQERLIIAPILERLTVSFGSQGGVEQHLLQLLDELRQRPPQEHGYAPGNLVNLLRVLRGDLRGTDLSALHIRQAFLQDTDMRDASLAGADTSGSVLADVFSWPACVALSGDGRFLAAGTSMGEVYVWRVLDRTLVAKLKAHDGMTLAVALSDNADRLASCSDDGTARVWNPHNGQLLHTFTGHAGGALAVALSGNGALIASGDALGAIHVWNVDDGAQRSSVEGRGEAIWGMALDTIGGNLAIACGSQVQVWDANSGELIATLGGHTGGNFSVGLSADGRVVAAGSFDGNARVWQVHGGQLIAALPEHEGGAWSVALSGDGAKLVSGSFNGTVRAWDTREGVLTATMRGHTGGLRGVAISREGGLVGSASYDGTVRLWQADGGLLGELRGFTSGIRAVALSANGQLCATASFDRTVRMWDVDQGQLIKTLEGHTGGVWALGMSADGTVLASGGDDGTVRVWETARDQSMAVLRGHASAIWSIAVGQDGVEVISGSLDGTVRVWSTQLRKEVATLNAQTGPVWAVALSRDGRSVASGGVAGLISVWEGPGRTALRTFRAHSSPIFSVSFSGDAQLLATASFDATARLWDARSGDCLGTLEGHVGGVWCATLSVDGQLLATAGFDGGVRIWDVRTQAALKILRGHTAGIWSLAFDESARVLASAGVDGTIVIWDVETGAALGTLRRDRIYERLDITGLLGVTDAQRDALLALGAIDHESNG